MNLDDIRRGIERRFDCRCRITATPIRSYPGHSLVSVVFDTVILPRTWEAFLHMADELSGAIVDYLRNEIGLSDGVEIDVDHAARFAHLSLLPVGMGEVVPVPDAPEYFERTHQLAIFHRGKHTGWRARMP
ncbi:hypothetical protein OTERR_20980 [Oryzomicrobium terrae]|uniref:Uncharacterized protein n=1 Tax=Oryzomicrobium terrae TaxID=1735038 RepID=A0A5C1EAB4_9RHOO|nr:hypothetical protein [Oryzomicrobium terrae]QEL65574.1 hypothetical protein OTERR_20980 [Oryzomicrobium terrae]